MISLHYLLILDAGDNQLVEVVVEVVVVDLEVAVEVVVFVEGGLQGVGEVVLPGVVDEVVVSGEGGDHRTILCNVFHIAAVFLLWR